VEFGPLFQMKPIVVYKQRSLLSLDPAKREMFLASQIITQADQLLIYVHSSPLIFFSKTSKRSSKNKVISARRKYPTALTHTASYTKRSKCELKPLIPGIPTIACFFIVIFYEIVYLLLPSSLYKRAVF